MFSKRNAAASSKAAQKSSQKGLKSPMGVRYVSSPTSSSSSGKAGKSGKGDSRADRRAAKAAQKSAQKAAAQVNGKVGKADRLAAARAAASAKSEAASKKRLRFAKSDKKQDQAWDKPVYAPGEEPSRWDVSEWSLRRKVALVLALPVIVAAVFGGLRINAERKLASEYAASASQVTVLGPAIDYLAAAQRAGATARQVGINDPKLDEAQREVVEAATKLVEARDRADLTPTQLRQVNDAISLSEQLRNGMAYVSVSSTVSQVRQLERGVTQIISTIINAQSKPEPALLTLAQALDGRLSLSLQEIQVGNKKTPVNPAELYREFGVELASIDRLAIALGQTDARVLEIRQANAQRVAGAGNDVDESSGSGIKITKSSYEAYDVLIEDLLLDIDTNLADSANKAKVLTWVDSLIIGLALLAAIILALLVSRLILNPIRRVRSGALEVAHSRLPDAVARIRAGEDPGEIVPIGVTTHEETGQLARAVDDLHRQAVKLASGEAALRAQVGDMFVTLSRRNTSLINQQLSLIETLESDEEDPQRLESLFRLDHLASRMRRNAESLVILSGAPTRATEQDDLSLTDVLQAAIAGVQDYKRVQLDAAPAQRVSGEVAPDVVHLLAELVDNALSYSPPSSRALVTSSFTRGGVIVQVTDAGLGIAEDALTELNEKLRTGGEVNSDTARRMGLFVVSRLAQRHGLTVQLDHNDRMGITATVFLPTSVLSDTARLEAGSGGAQVIELGTASTSTDGHEDVDAYQADGEWTEGGTDDVVAYLHPEGQPVDQPHDQPHDQPQWQPEPEQQPEPEIDPITAAINAYGLPQRRPGASGAGSAGTPVSMGGGFFDRVEPDEQLPALSAPAPSVIETPETTETVHHTAAGGADTSADVADEERAPIALGPVDDGSDVAEVSAATEEDTDTEVAQDEVAQDEVAQDEVEAPVAEVEDEPADDEQPAPVATLPLPGTEPFEPTLDADAEHGNGNGNGNGMGRSHGNLAARLHSLAAAARNSSDEREEPDDSAEVEAEPTVMPAAWSTPDETPETEPVASEGSTAPAVPVVEIAAVESPAESQAEIQAEIQAGEIPAASALDEPLSSFNGAARTAASMDEDETPIFRSLRSNWLSVDTGERPWADSEVDAGWDAASRVEATPPTRRTETGLPMRRPGNRLIPGGLSEPAPAQTVRDPDAIRARLAAHAAGVSRGRNAATVPHPSSPSTQEADPA